MVNKMKLMKVRDRLLELHGKLYDKISNSGSQINVSDITPLVDIIDDFTNIIHKK